MSDTVLYFWSIDGVKFGPAALDRVRELVRNGKIPMNATLWSQGWPEWKTVESVSHELAIPNMQRASNKLGAKNRQTMTFFIYSNDQSKGPYTMSQLRKMWEAGTLTGSDLYCENGSNNWSHLSDLEYDLEAPPAAVAPVRSAYAPQQVPYELRQRQWSPGVAIVLSFFIPGLGQMYRGKIGRGLLWLIFVPIGYFALVVPGLILHLLCIVNSSSGDPTKPGDAK